MIHSGDVHLGSDPSARCSPAAPLDRYCRVFQRIVDHTLAEDADLLLIAGDLFDHDRVPDELVAFVQAELARLRQPVVILPGNHDALHTRAIYDRHDFATASGHVHVIRERDGQSIDFPGLTATVWGRAMDEHRPEFRPLDGIPGRAGGRWCLAMAHGFFYEQRREPERSSPIFAEDIRDSGWDYLALGHQHVQTNVSQGSVAAYYSGAPLLDWSTPNPRGALLHVELSEADGVRVTSTPIR